MDEVIPNFSISNIHSSIDYLGDELAIFDSVTTIPTHAYPSRINGVFVAICLKGSFKLEINLKEYDLTPNGLMIIFRDEIVQEISRSDDFEGCFMLVSLSFLEEILKGNHNFLRFHFLFKSTPIIKLQHAEIDLLVEMHSMIRSKVRAVQNHFRREVVGGLVFSMFYEMYNLCNGYITEPEVNVRNRKQCIYEQFMKDVLTCYKTERSVSFYSERQFLTSKHLSSVVKEVSGKTVGEWIDNFVILEARSLLKSSDMNVQQIAEYLNFANQSFFGKYFKHHTGMSPKEYRQL